MIKKQNQMVAKNLTYINYILLLLIAVSLLACKAEYTSPLSSSIYSHQKDPGFKINIFQIKSKIDSIVVAPTDGVIEEIESEGSDRYVVQFRSILDSGRFQMKLIDCEKLTVSIGDTLSEGNRIAILNKIGQREGYIVYMTVFNKNDKSILPSHRKFKGCTRSRKGSKYM